MHDIDKAYIAGLFDGEACFSIKQRMKKRKPSLKAYPTWDIRIEINMTDQSVIRWVYEVLGCGSFSKKPPGKGQLGKKMQWRWRCSHRDAYYVCCLLWPFAHTKLPKIQQIIEHYTTQKLKSKAKVINLEEYKNAQETSL
jgi:hypothetical protein